MHERKLAAATVSAYISDLKLLNSWLDGTDVRQIQRRDIRAFMRWLSAERGFKANTIRRIVHGLATFWKWLLVEGIVNEVITSHIDLPRKNETQPTWMDETQLVHLVNVSRGVTNYRDGLAIRFMAYTGVRPSEMLSLRIVNVLENALIIRNTKSRKDRVLAPSRAILDEMHRYCAGRPTDHFVFGHEQRWDRKSFYQRFYEILRAADLDDRGFTPYTLRHTFGTHLALAGVPPHVISELMGHEDITTTRKYTHAAVSNLNEAMNKFVLNREG